MPVIEFQTQLTQPVSEIYQRATDFDGLRARIPDIVNVELISGKPLRAGSMISMRKKQMGSEIFINADIMEVERNKSLEMTGMWGRFPFRRRTEFSPMGRECMVRDRLTLKTGILFFWYAPILSYFVRNQLQKEWQSLNDV